MPGLTTSIQSVEVYPDRARVVRRGTLDLQPGVQRLEIADLPLTMNTDSARVAARGTAQARLSGLQISRVYYAETPAVQARELESQLEAAQDEMQALDAALELGRQNRARTDELSGQTQLYATALASGEMSLEQQVALLDGLRQRAAALDAEVLDLLGRKRSLQRRIDQIKAQLDQQRSARPRERNAAFVDVEVLEAGELTVDLTYVVSNAGWKPLYDLRLLEKDAQPSLEIGYLAQVTQRSGEDWLDVDLTLSTARPALAATLPELKPWFVQPKPPPVPMQAQARGAAQPMMAMAAPAPAGAAAMDEEAPKPKRLAEAETVMAQVDTSGTAVTYHVPGKTGVPSDGAPHKVTVARYPLKPELDYVTAPRLVAAAYRRAVVANDSPYTLLPGLANLFAGDEFIGATNLELTAPQGEIELYLGVDDRIKVEYELVRRDVDKSLLGGKRRVRYAYEIELENLLNAPAKLTIHDHMPTSRHEDIKVRLESAEPRPTEQTELNLLNWELTLKPKEKRTLRYDFVVEYPQAMEVIGLP